jgi:hypothetical protein
MPTLRSCAKVLACGLLIGCGGLLGINQPTDADGTAPPAQNGDDGGAAADGGGPLPRDASVGDGAQDAAVADRTARGDAPGGSSGDGAATDADASRADVGCPTNPPFICADADPPDGLTFFTDFDKNCLAIPVIQTSQPSLYELSCAQFVSPPASLHLQTPSLGGYTGYLNLEKSLHSFPKHSHVEFDFMVTSLVPKSAANAFALGADKFGAMGSGFVLFLVPDPNLPSVIDCFVQDYQPDGTPDQAQDCTGGIPLQTWTHLVFDMQRSDAGLPMHLTIAVKGSGLLFDRDLRAFVDGPNFHFDLRSGTFEDGGGHWDFYFDNVSVLDQ